VQERPLFRARDKTMLFLAGFDRAMGTAMDYEYEDPRLQPDGSRWHLIRVSPGEYVFLGLLLVQSGGGAWGACYGDDTHGYRIGANEALFIGEIDPVPSVDELTRQVVLEEKTKTQLGQQVYVHDNVRVPKGNARDRFGLFASTCLY